MPHKSPQPPFHMSLLIRMPKEPRHYGVLTEALHRLGITVNSGEPIRETATFVIRDVRVTFQGQDLGPAVLKTIRSVRGAEVMNFSISH